MLPYFNIRGNSRQDIRKTHDVDFVKSLCNILERKKESFMFPTRFASPTPIIIMAPSR
jgi:hypothetical protein